jgi:putative ABC transport system permease protein
MFGELAQLALHNLLRARARLAMTAGGVLVGTAAVVLLIALTIGLQNAAEAGIGSSNALTEIYVYTAWSPNPDTPRPKLDLESVRTLSAIEGVLVVIPTYDMGAQLESGKLQGWASIMGIDPRLLPYLGLNAAQGALALERGQVLVGGQVGNNFYDPKSETYEPQFVDMYGERVNVVHYSSAGTPRKDKLNVAGVLAMAGNSFDYGLLMPIQDAIALREWATGEKVDPKTFEYSQIIVRSKNREVTQAVSDAIRKLGYGVGGMGDYLKALNDYFSTMRVMLGGIGGVALLVAAFGVANTMTMAILERTREIGLMKAVGATDGNILTVFLVEAGSVGFFGGLAGLSVSLLVQSVVNQAIANAPRGDGGGGVSFLPIDLNNFNGELVVIPLELMLFGLALATGVGLLAGFYPSLRAARMTTVTALKTD